MITKDHTHIYDAVIKYKDIEHVVKPKDNLRVSEIMEDNQLWKQNDKEII